MADVTAASPVGAELGQIARILAEVEGFEPPVVSPTLAFKASAFGRSATLPSPVSVTQPVEGVSGLLQSLADVPEERLQVADVPRPGVDVGE